MNENPLDQLGLKKELVQYLHQSGRLFEFLKQFYHSVQHQIHPDVGGDNNLAAIINNAYSEIRSNQGNIPAWLQSMQNGHHPEYLEVIDGLSAEVERLRKVESEKEELARKYASLLASRAGKTDAGKIRTASPRARRVSFEGEYEPRAEEPEAEEREEAPRVRRASARRVPAEEPSARASSKEEKREARRTAEPIVLENIILYDAKGRPAITYKKVTLDGEAVKDSRGSHMTKHQDGWIDYFKSLGDGRTLPSLPVYYAVIERLQETKHPAAAGLLKDLKESWLCTNTRIDYAEKTIIHGYGSEPYSLRCLIPVESVWLDEVKSKKGWQAALQALLMPKELNQAIDVMQEFSSKRSYIWTPDAESRKSVPQRALWLNVDPERLGLFADFHPAVGGSRSRGVRLEK